MLGNSAGLGRGNGGVSDCIKERCFAVVNVTHYAYNGITGNKILIIILAVVDNSVLDCNNNCLFALCTKLGCNDFGCIVVDNLVDRCHLTEGEELFDNLCRRHVEKCGKVADRNLLGNLNVKLRLLCSLGRNSLEPFRFGLTARFHAGSVYDICYKKDELGDPLINDHHAVALGAVTYEELELIYAMTSRINEILRNLFAKMNIKLVDFKIEFGRTSDGEIVLADEVSPDTCRLWDMTTNEKLDKDRFRRDLGKVREAYEEILARLQKIVG